MKRLYLFIAGAVAFAACEILWLSFSEFTFSKWILELTPGILMCSIVMISVASVLTYIFHLEMKSLNFLIAGSTVSLTVMLFSVGPGNIWPIALMFDYLIMTVLAVIGWLIGVQFLNRKRKTT